MQTYSDRYVDGYLPEYGNELRQTLTLPSVEMSFGAELFDADEAFLDDISGDLDGAGFVEHGNYRTIHGTCQLRVSRQLQWGSQRVKPYMLVRSGDEDIRVNLGMFLLTTPSSQAGETPQTFQVDGYDKLEVLNHPHGTSYAAAAGDAYLTLVEALITAAGESNVRLDQSAAATTLPSKRVWPLDEQTRTLNIVNDLLAAVGYRALWVDQDGAYRSEPYKSPADRGSEWTYSADADATTVAEDRTADADFFDAPNRWVFIRDDPEQGLPTDGDGLYTVTNQSDGPTSVDSRGRTITRVVTLSAANQTSLVTQGDRIVELDKRVPTKLAVKVVPNPLHLHFDVVRYRDAQLAVDGRYVLQTWRLPLDGSDMELEMRSV